MPLPRKREAARASFDPDSFTTGSSVPDGDYVITSCTTGMFVFGSFGEHAAFLVTYQDDNGTEHLVPYKAGDNKYILPSEDGENFVNPDDPEVPPKIYSQGDAAKWLKSWREAGHKFESDDASQFNGIRVRLVSELVPRGKGTGENPNKTVQLIAKILGTGKGAPSSRPTAARPNTSARSVSVASRNAPATSRSNGDLSDTAIDLVKQVLSKRDGQVLELEKLPNAVWMKAKMDAKLKPQAQAIKDIITAEWLESQDGIETDGENVALA